MKVISVKCPSPDGHLHLAPLELGRGVSVHTLTLCLEPWTKREPARKDSILCAECVAKWAANQTEEHGE